MNEDLYRIDMSKIFLFVGKYKLLLIFLPVLLTAAVFVSTLVIEPVYKFSARFVPCYITDPNFSRELFVKNPYVFVSEINAGAYQNSLSQEFRSSSSSIEIKARLLDRRVVEIAFEGRKDVKGEEALEAMLTEIINDENETTGGYKQTEDDLALLKNYEVELDILREKFQASTDLNAESIDHDAPDGNSLKDFTMLSDVYMQLTRIEIQLQSMELRISRIAKQLPTQMQVHEMEIILPPNRIPQQVYPQTGLWVIVALFLGLVGAFLLALLIDSYLKYRAERSNT